MSFIYTIHTTKNTSILSSYVYHERNFRELFLLVYDIKVKVSKSTKKTFQVAIEM
jgi:hypothetical protein